MSLENINKIQKELLDFNPATKEEVGNLTSLTTTTKQDLVSALNEQVTAYKTNKAATDAQILAINSGSPKGVYPTLTALQTAFPTGATGTYIVSADGKWYYWSGSAWTIGGPYLNTAKVPSLFDFNNQVSGILNLFRTTDITMTTGTALRTDGTTTTNGAYNAQNSMVSEYIDLSGFTHVNALIMRDSAIAIVPIAFYDNSSVLVGTYTNGNISDSNFKKITIPIGATRMRYAYHTDAQATTQSVPVFTYLSLSNEASLLAKQTVLRSDVDAAQSNITILKANTDNLGQAVSGLVTVNRTSITMTEGLALLPDGTTSTNGAFSAQNLMVSNFITVTGYTNVNALIYKNGALAIASIVFYDSNNTVTGYFASNATYVPSLQSVDIPANTTKMKYCYSTDARAEALAQTKFSYLELVNKNALVPSQASMKIDIDSLKSGTNTTAIDSVRIPSTNLFDQKAITPNKELQAFAIVDSTTQCISDYIPFTTGETIYGFNGSGATYIWYYDSAKTKLGFAQITTSNNAATQISISNVAYIRINVLNTLAASLIISKAPIVRYEKPKLIAYNNIEAFNNGAINWWQGKNGAALGDSLTGAGYYQKYVRQYFNLAKYTNHGIGGTKLSGAANGSGDSMWMDSRINSIDVTADFISVLGGQNDGNVTIGSLTLENYNTNEYVGALNVLISKIYYKYQRLSEGYYASSGITYSGVSQIASAKNILIFLCTPFYVPSETDPYRTKNLANAVREVAKLWGLPVIDFAARSQLNAGVKDVYWGSDRTHPVEICYRDRLAPVMISEIEKFKPVNFDKAYYV